MRTVISGILLCCAAWPAAKVQLDVFRAGEGGYHTYRIPALVTTRRGTLLAFCEARKSSSSDTGDIDVLLRRSRDGGKTWTLAQKIADRGADTIGNPAPVVEWKTGTIFLLLTGNAGTATERQITEASSQAGRSVWILRSTDDGATWTPPVEITAQVKRPEWTWYATGPGNGIQLRSGRLVVPCDHNTRAGNERHSHTIYSDDGGQSWRIGGIAENQTNESAVVERKDGSLLLNMRSYHGRNRRAVQRSVDGGLSWSALEFDDILVEPVCQASLISAARPGKRSNGRLLFSNPAAITRSDLTVRLSDDDGLSWTSSRLIHQGPSAYSSLSMLPDGSVGLLFEMGEKTPYERITFERFDLGWIRSGRP